MADEIEELLKRKAGLGDKVDDKTTPKEREITLEEAIEQLDQSEAKELIRAKARQLRAEIDLKTQELEKRLAGGAKVTTEDTSREEQERKLREEIASTAKMLLDRGVDPKVVGQYILGSSSGIPITIAAPGGTQAAQGITVDDIKKIWDMALEKRGGNDQALSKLEATLASLQAEVKAIADRKPMSPIEFAEQQAQQIEAYYNTLKKLGIIKEPEKTGGTGEGEPLEVVKERHRHEEKMEELKTERTYKEKLGETIAEIPERVGRGIASQLSEAEEEKTGAVPKPKSFKCNCGHEIPIPPVPTETLTCGHCGAVYQRTE